MSDPKQDWPTRTAAQHDSPVSPNRALPYRLPPQATRTRILTSSPFFETLPEQVPDANLFGVTEALCSESPQDRASLAQRVTEVCGL